MPRDGRIQGGDAAGARAHPIALAAIALGAVAVAAAVGVRGDFPLNDDFSYAWATRTLCQEGELRLLPWTGASVLAQVGYGAVLCRIFGFSFTVLRISTLLLATVGVVTWWALLRRIGVRGGMLALATIVFALDPLYVNLAFTFMTDVPFTAVMLIAAWWYVRGIQDRDDRSLLVGSVAASIALLIRQPGALLVAAAALAIVMCDDRPRRQRLAALAAAALLPSVVFLGYHAWLFGVHGAPSGYTNKIAEALHVRMLAAANCTFRGVQYLGLLSAPIMASLLRDQATRRPRQLAAWTAVLALLALGLWVREGALLYNLPNVLYDFGLGPLTLRDTQVLGMAPPVQLGLALRIPLTVVATLGGAVLCTALSDAVAALRPRRAAGPRPVATAGGQPRAALGFLLLTAVLLFIGASFQARYYFDRYLVVVLPFAIATVLAAVPRRVPSGAGVLLAVALAWLAVAGTHDYLAWNRARYAGLAHLEAAGVPVEQIDGGFEYNSWLLAPKLGGAPSDADVPIGQAATRRSWWWVIDDRYVLSFHELPGYRIREAIPYIRWLVPGRGRVFVLERIAAR